jgi:hypothetical protein
LKERVEPDGKDTFTEADFATMGTVTTEGGEVTSPPPFVRPSRGRLLGARQDRHPHRVQPVGRRVRE